MTCMVSTPYKAPAMVVPQNIGPKLQHTEIRWSEKGDFGGGATHTFLAGLCMMCLLVERIDR